VITALEYKAMQRHGDNEIEHHIDTYIRSVAWKIKPEVVVPMRPEWEAATINRVLLKYQAAGWTVSVRGGVIYMEAA